MAEMIEGRRDLGDFPVNDVKEKTWTAPTLGSAPRREEPYSDKRTPPGVLATLVILGVALAALAWYDYSVFQKHKIQLAELPGVSSSLTGMGKRMDGVESRLRAWAIDQDALVERVGKLDSKFTANLRLARKQTQELIAQVQTNMQQELNKRTQIIEARLSRFESDQQAERARLAQLQNDVANVRQEVAAVRGDTGRQLASLGQQQTQSQGKLEAIATQLERQRVDFELAKNETRELVPGISLHISHADASYQRFEGWLWFLPDRRTLWIVNQGAQEPVVFRSKQGGEPYELIVTGVNKRGVAGYLLVPVAGSSGTKESASVDNGVTAAARPAF